MLNNIDTNGVLKKLCTIIAFTLSFFAAKAQVKIGVLGGLGKSSLYKFPFSPDDYNRYSSVIAYWAGINAELPINQNGVSLFGSATYSKKGYHYLYQTETGNTNTIQDSGYTQNLKYADINLMLRKKFSMSETSSFFVSTGPGASIFTAGSEKVDLTYFGTSMPSTTKTQNKLTVGNAAGAYKRVFMNWEFAVGFEVSQFSFWLNAGIPLNDYYVDPGQKIPHKIKTFGITAAYNLFTLVKREKEEKRKPEPPAPPVKIDSLLDSDGDGIPDKDDRCPGHKGVAKYFGCPVPDTDGDGINDDEDKCPTIAGVAANNGCPAFTDTVKKSTKDTSYFTVYFEPAKSILRTEAYNTLTEVVKLLKANPKLVVLFKGHTDFAGNEEANNKRALERAKTCADYVESFYIEKGRLKYIGFGNKFPAADLNDPLLQWKNRRVEICVFEKD
jgi:outer membrane protein OmpA-like peptidoglycan-associated protein